MLNTADANLLIIGTYWPSGTIINENKYCTPLIIGDMNATTSAHDQTSTYKYIADKMYQDYIKDHNPSPLPQIYAAPSMPYCTTAP